MLKETIKALLPLIKVKEDSEFLWDEQLKYCEKSKRESWKPMFKIPDQKNNIQPEYLASNIICGHANDDTIFTADTGMTCMYGEHAL